MASVSNRVPTARQREWLEHVLSCRAQGMSLKAYAEQQALSLQRLYHWHRRLKLLGFIDSPEAIGFAEVRIRRPGKIAGAQRLHFPNGLVLEWGGSADPGLIEQLLVLSQASR
jgi:hypothetical protein